MINNVYWLETTCKIKKSFPREEDRRRDLLSLNGLCHCLHFLSGPNAMQTETTRKQEKKRSKIVESRCERDVF